MARSRLTPRSLAVHVVFVVSAPYSELMFHRFSRHILFIWALGPCAASPAFAAVKSRVQIGENVPQVKLSGESRLQIIFDQERVAELAVKQVRTSPYTVNLKSTEDTCSSSKVKIDCRLNYDIALNLFSPIWVSHPNRDQISRPVKSRAKDMTPVITLVDSSMRFALAAKTQQPYSDLADSLAPTRMSCNNLSWLPKSASEFESVNFESLQMAQGHFESRVRRIFRKQRFQKTATDLEFKEMQKYSLNNFTISGGLYSPFISEKMAFVFRNPAKQCRVSFSTDADRSRLGRTLFDSTSPFMSIDFSKVSWGVKSLTDLQADEFSAHNDRLKQIFDSLSEDLKLLFIFSLVDVEITNVGVDEFDVKVTGTKIDL